MNQKIGDVLRSRLGPETDTDMVELNVFLRGNPAAEILVRAAVSDDRSSFASAAEHAIELTRRDQDSVLPLLERNRAEIVESLWVNNLICARLPTGALRSTLKSLEEREDVEFVEEARYASMVDLMDGEPVTTEAPASAAAVSALNGSRATWNVGLLEAPALWAQGITGEGIVVAVIDSGVNYRHPDLARRMWRDPVYGLPGFDFGRDTPDPMDQGGNGHGTACAGLIAGDGASGEITGIAPGAIVMALRVGNADNMVSDWSIWRAFQFAIRHRAHVISMSMSWKRAQNPNYPGWRRVCDSVLAAGILHANSIGNLGSSKKNTPYNIGTPGDCPPPYLHPQMPLRAGTSSVVACGATAQGDLLAADSGHGPVAWEHPLYPDYPLRPKGRQGLMRPDLCAPGVGAKSCNWQFSAGSPPQIPAYVPFRGTSAAAAQVAGCMALLAQACQLQGTPIVPATIQQALEHTAKRLPGQMRDKENGFGAGRVRVRRAFQYGQDRSWWSAHAPAPRDTEVRALAAEAQPRRAARGDRSKLSVRLAEALAGRPADELVNLTVLTELGQAEQVAGALLQLPTTQRSEAIPETGMVFFVGPLSTVHVLTPLPEVRYIDLETWSRLMELLDR